MARPISGETAGLTRQGCFSAEFLINTSQWGDADCGDLHNRLAVFGPPDVRSALPGAYVPEAGGYHDGGNR
jgi:hypothetical protein